MINLLCVTFSVADPEPDPDPVPDLKQLKLTYFYPF
jgi:hypothetical protein